MLGKLKHAVRTSPGEKRALDNLPNAYESSTSNVSLWRRWAYLLSWLVHAIALAAMLGLLSINMIKYWKVSNGDDLRKYLRQGVTLDLSPRHLSPHDLTQLEAEWTAKDKNEGPLPPTYHYTVDGKVIYTYCATALPFAVMGLLTIAFATLPSEAAWAPSIFRFKSAASRWLSQPLLPHRYWLTAFGGVSVAEAILYAWSIAVQVCYLVYVAEDKEAKWRRGDVKKGVHNLPTSDHMQYTLEWLGKALGVLFTLQGVFLFVPVGRGSIVNNFLSLSYGQTVKWHRLLGWQVVFCVLAHGVLFQALWISSSWDMWVTETFRWRLSHGVSNLAGTLSWAALAGMTFTLLPIIRRRSYSLFYYSHVAGALLFILFGTIHHPENYQWAAAGIIMWSIDVAYRLLQTSQPVDMTATVHYGSDIVSIRIPCQESLEYKDHSHVWVCVPEISRLAFHPFSVITCPDADPSWNSSILLQSKVAGMWTKALCKMAGAESCIQARIQGPYGGSNLEAAEQQQYSSMLYITGGTGLASVLACLQRCAVQRQSTQAGDALPPMTLVFCVRAQCELQMLAPLLRHLDVISVRVHYTGKAPLHDAAYTNPPPLPLSTSRKTAPPFGSLRQYATVWAVSYFALFWLLGAPSAWADRTDSVQLGFTKSEKMTQYYLTLAAAVAASLLPLAILALWRVLTLRATNAVRAADPCVDGIPVDSLSLSSDFGRERVSVAAPRTAAWDTDMNTVVVRTNPDSVQPAVIRSIVSGHKDIAIATGRPEMLALAAECEGARLVGIWVGGPQAMNNAVLKAFGSRIGRTADLHVTTAEL